MGAGPRAGEGGGGKGRGDPPPAESWGGRSALMPGAHWPEGCGQSRGCVRKNPEGQRQPSGPGGELGGAQEGERVEGSTPARGGLYPAPRCRAAKRRAGRPRLAAAARGLLAQNRWDRCGARPYLIPRATPPPLTALSRHTEPAPRRHRTPEPRHPLLRGACWERPWRGLSRPRTLVLGADRGLSFLSFPEGGAGRATQKRLTVACES